MFPACWLVLVYLVFNTFNPSGCLWSLWAELHLNPASLRAWTSLNALLPLRKVVNPITAAPGSIWNSFHEV